MPNFFPENNTALPSDNTQRSLQKIVSLIGGSSGGGGSPTTYALGGNFSGSGSPEGVVSAYPGAEYADTTNHLIYHKISGAGTNTGWE